MLRKLVLEMDRLLVRLARVVKAPTTLPENMMVLVARARTQTTRLNEDILAVVFDGSMRPTGNQGEGFVLRLDGIRFYPVWRGVEKSNKKLFT
mmetsp:Transcript_31603/g.66281  ORF Transcript_31603/g.66281 Transcript_31603/m.66281 type:complete len:93 (+) Transcript_31603:612-890(+)